ncbi:hypothetical protein D1AOALGA4SA_8936 [Olavius algarvensis Delta 1 endosymbiont]|nr:hypothetical protein D1AOALGA4SA_8936 [Olavius algarvensis Delta 1 endosymbiont]
MKRTEGFDCGFRIAECGLLEQSAEAFDCEFRIAECGFK